MIRVVFVIAGLIVAVLLFGRVPNCANPTQPVGKPAQVVEVQLWTGGITTGYTKVNLRDRTIRAKGTQLVPDRWSSFCSRTTTGEAERLAGLANMPAFRGFAPRSAWFSELNVPDGSSVLVLVWPDRKLALAVPPLEVRTALPSDAEAVYKQVDKIRWSLEQLERKYARPPVLTKPKQKLTGKEADEFDKEMDRVWSISLPKPRVGW